MRKFLFSVVFLFLTLCSYAYTSDIMQGVFFSYTPDRNDNKTASGEEFDTEKPTCAHASLPFGTTITILGGEKDSPQKVTITDRIDMPNEFFALAPSVLLKLKGDLKPIKCKYTIDKEGKGDIAWKTGGADDKWFRLSNIKSKDPFALYDQLRLWDNGNYKACYTDGALEILYVSKSFDKRLKTQLAHSGADVSSIQTTPLKFLPLR